jgi:hypothetical protein
MPPQNFIFSLIELSTHTVITISSFAKGYKAFILISFQTGQQHPFVFLKIEFHASVSSLRFIKIPPLIFPIPILVKFIGPRKQVHVLCLEQ